MSHHKQSVLIVGAGITGLVCAYVLAKKGFRVTVADSNSDPRRKSEPQHNTSWRFNARQITIAESHSFLSPEKATLLKKDLMYGGWNALPRYKVGVAERRWLETFTQLARQKNVVETHNQQLLLKNHHGLLLWRALTKELPELFDCNPQEDSITRIHHCTKRLSQDFRLHQGFHLHSTTPLSSEEVLRRGQLSTHSLRTSQFRGGITVEGYSVEAQRFTHKLLDLIETQGVTLQWNTTARATKKGATITLQNSDGALLAFKHYVLAPGAYGLELLNSAVPSHHVHGLAGAWIQVRNPGVKHSCKVHYEKPPVEDINLCVSKDRKTLFLSGGYGYIGTHSLEKATPWLDPLLQALIRKTKALFPRLRSNDIVDEGFCVRPFDALGLSLYEVAKSPSGNCIITAGHGTAGWTQAPYIAQKVVRDLLGSVEQDTATSSRISLS